MHLFSNSSSTIATISSLLILELFPACFSCSNNFNRSHNSLGSYGKNIVFEIPEAEIITPGDLSNLISILSLVLLLPEAFFIKVHFLCKNQH